MDGPRLVVKQPRALQFAEDAHHSASAMHVFHMVERRARRYLAEIGHLAGKPIDILHGEIELGFLRSRQEVQNRIG